MTDLHKVLIDVCNARGILPEREVIDDMVVAVRKYWSGEQLASVQRLQQENERLRDALDDILAAVENAGLVERTDGHLRMAPKRAVD